MINSMPRPGLGRGLGDCSGFVQECEEWYFELIMHYVWLSDEDS